MPYIPPVAIFGDSQSSTKVCQQEPATCATAVNGRYALDGKNWTDYVQRPTVNLAWSGRTSADLPRQISEFLAKPESAGVKFAVIAMGTNDVLHDTPRTTSNIAKAISGLKRRGIDTIVIGVDVFLNSEAGSLNNSLALIPGVNFIGLPVVTPSTWDGVHWSSETSQRLGKIVSERLDQI
jgi:hypothetical protein